VIAAYIDSSVVIRILFNEDDPLHEWQTLDLGISSVLLRLECRRSIERLWRQHQLSDAELETTRSKANEMLRYIEYAGIDDAVIALASEPFPTFVNSLDAIHLATAVEYRRRQVPDERPILFATHDGQLAKAAAAMHFEVIGADF
jgi:predicted nucleic acid-binding protein